MDSLPCVEQHPKIVLRELCTKRPSEVDQQLIRRIRNGDGDAWNDLIGRYEGRLLAFVDSRLSNRSSSSVTLRTIGLIQALQPGHKVDRFRTSID